MSFTLDPYKLAEEGRAALVERSALATAKQAGEAKLLAAACQQNWERLQEAAAARLGSLAPQFERFIYTCPPIGFVHATDRYDFVTKPFEYGEIRVEFRRSLKWACRERNGACYLVPSWGWLWQTRESSIWPELRIQIQPRKAWYAALSFAEAVAAAHEAHQYRLDLLDQLRRLEGLRITTAEEPASA